MFFSLSRSVWQARVIIVVIPEGLAARRVRESVAVAVCVCSHPRRFLSGICLFVRKPQRQTADSRLRHSGMTAL